MDSRQREIAAAAVQLIAERGFGRTGVRDFAAVLNVSVRALYQTVRTKEEILALVVNHWAELWRAELEPIMALEVDPLDRLRRAVTALVAFGNEHPAFSAVIYRESTRLDPAGRRILAAREKERIDLFAGLVSEVIHTGVFRPDLDPGLLAAQLLVLVDAVAVRRSLSLDVNGTEAWSETMLEMVINGCGAAIRPGS